MLYEESDTTRYRSKIFTHSVPSPSKKKNHTPFALPNRFSSSSISLSSYHAPRGSISFYPNKKVSGKRLTRSINSRRSSRFRRCNTIPRVRIPIRVINFQVRNVVITYHELLPPDLRLLNIVGPRTRLLDQACERWFWIRWVSDGGNREGMLNSRDIGVRSGVARGYVARYHLPTNPIPLRRALKDGRKICTAVAHCLPLRLKSDRTSACYGPCWSGIAGRAGGRWRQGFDENRHVGRRRPGSGGFFWRVGIFPEVLASAGRRVRGVATLATEGAATGCEGVGVGGGVLLAGRC